MDNQSLFNLANSIGSNSKVPTIFLDDYEIWALHMEDYLLHNKNTRAVQGCLLETISTSKTAYDHNKLSSSKINTYTVHIIFCSFLKSLCILQFCQEPMHIPAT